MAQKAVRWHLEQREKDGHQGYQLAVIDGNRGLHDVKPYGQTVQSCKIS